MGWCGWRGCDLVAEGFKEQVGISSIDMSESQWRIGLWRQTNLSALLAGFKLREKKKKIEQILMPWRLMEYL